MTLGFALILIIAAAVVIGQAVTGEIWLQRIPYRRISRDENPGSFWLAIAFQSLAVLVTFALRIYPHLFKGK